LGSVCLLILHYTFVTTYLKEAENEAWLERWLGVKYEYGYE